MGALRTFIYIFYAGCNTVSVGGIKTKKGVPLYSNLVNLKSNTMKNTVQRYSLFSYAPNYCALNTYFYAIFNKNNVLLS